MSTIMIGDVVHCGKLDTCSRTCCVQVQFVVVMIVRKECRAAKNSDSYLRDESHQQEETDQF